MVIQKKLSLFSISRSRVVAISRSIRYISRLKCIVNDVIIFWCLTYNR